MQENRHPGRFCGNCAFWLHHADHLGSCRLHAPQPGEERDEVAHWAHTLREEYCGDWTGADATPLRAAVCKKCVYWSFLEGGLTPVDRRDELTSWWSAAGHCLRFAPQPAALSGHKACWRVTHAEDGCFDGEMISS
ncbi:hypothetical protein [Methylocystis heyeri]|uniref:Uncharacterized protein n=1 Tax=Methylocystis heyeri TaxID=391905 RepID=A0A6B8KHF8_9HYPH|nr:hypothetical protein [Methylocystis heyeri]QGM47097.1 hypothetical protein H2LOC_016145 [Methylocystis heyeri]